MENDFLVEVRLRDGVVVFFFYSRSPDAIYGQERCTSLPLGGWLKLDEGGKLMAIEFPAENFHRDFLDGGLEVKSTFDPIGAAYVNLMFETHDGQIAIPHQSDDFCVVVDTVDGLICGFEILGYFN
jgi:hypothetical protein